MAASRLYQLLKPGELSGRFMVVPMVNTPVLQFRTRWLNLRSSNSPMDGKNINSQFPGCPEVTVTSRIAHRLYTLLRVGEPTGY